MVVSKDHDERHLDNCKAETPKANVQISNETGTKTVAFPHIKNNASADASQRVVVIKQVGCWVPQIG
jgi:hypothetical protein